MNICSRPIYERATPNRYFLVYGLRPRYENRCLIFFSFRDDEEDESWHTLTGLFKIGARCPLTFCFLFIMFVNYYIIKVMQALQWQVPLLAISKTWVRTPGLCNFQYCFSIFIPMQAHLCGSPYALHPGHPRVH